MPAAPSKSPLPKTTAPTTTRAQSAPAASKTFHLDDVATSDRIEWRRIVRRSLPHQVSRHSQKQLHQQQRERNQRRPRQKLFTSMTSQRQIGLSGGGSLGDPCRTK